MLPFTEKSWKFIVLSFDFFFFFVDAFVCDLSGWQ
jgi:hypothetical protein